MDRFGFCAKNFEVLLNHLYKSKARGFCFAVFDNTAVGMLKCQEAALTPLVQNAVIRRMIKYFNSARSKFSRLTEFGIR